MKENEGSHDILIIENAQVLHGVPIFQPFKQGTKSSQNHFFIKFLLFSQNKSEPAVI